MATQPQHLTDAFLTPAAPAPAEQPSARLKPTLYLAFDQANAQNSWAAIPPTRVFALFENRLIASGCRILKENPNNRTAFAAYKPFIYLPLSGGHTFVNTLLLPRAHGGVSRSDNARAISKWHEGNHALQHAGAPVLHATPQNEATRVVLCPEDYILATILQERDAYAKTAWMGSLASRDENLSDEQRADIAVLMNKQLITTTEFDQCLEQSGDLQEALGRASLLWDQKRLQRSDAPSIAAIDHYINEALTWYEESVKGGKLALKPLSNFVSFVRMEDSDIVRIGQGLGPGTFGDAQVRSEFKNLPLSEEQRARLDALNTKLNIANRDALPTFTEELAKAGETPETFLERSKQHTVLRVPVRYMVSAKRSLPLEIQVEIAEQHLAEQAEPDWSQMELAQS